MALWCKKSMVQHFRTSGRCDGAHVSAAENMFALPDNNNMVHDRGEICMSSEYLMGQDKKN